MKHVSFQLTMPNVGSWNGKWTGEDRKYYIVKKFSDKFFKSEVEKLFTGKTYNSWYYNFGDGWGASVSAEIINSVEARKRRKVSRGFCGYNWMVESILRDGVIKTRTRQIGEVDGIAVIEEY